MQQLLAPDFLASVDELSASFRKNKPCPHVVIENFLSEDFCAQLAAGFPACDQDVLARFEANNQRGGKSKKQNISELGDAFIAFDRLIQAPEFLQLLTRITGIPDLLYDPDYYGGGTHESLNGERLLPHIDYNYHPKTGWYRRLNLLFYLNPEWDAQWGGLLELHSNPLEPDVDAVKACAIGLNNCTILETTSTSWHGFPAIELPVDKRHLSRRSIAVYYYTATPPVDDTSLNRSTVYINEPMPSRFSQEMLLAEDDILSLRELWQMRGNLSRELLEEIILHGYQFLYPLAPGMTFTADDVKRAEALYRGLERLSDEMERFHLLLRNPSRQEEIQQASWLRQSDDSADQP